VPVIDAADRQITLKLVYVGPEGAGKTTNLESLHALAAADHRGARIRLEGDQKRAPFFDLLPIFFRLDGLLVRFKIYSVPGKAAHRMARRAVLRGADGVVFVVDSDPGERNKNEYAFSELQEDMSMLAGSENAPILTQFNKRDQKEATKVEPFGEEPTIEAVASDGLGVRETLLEIAELSWQVVEKRTDLPEGLNKSPKDFRAELAAHIAKP
jgi:signal recognition particle receptor subunit beta